MGLALRASTPGAQGEGLPNHLFLVTTGGSENTPEKPNTGSTMPSSALQSYQTSEDAPLGAGPGRGPDSASASRGGPEQKYACQGGRERGRESARTHCVRSNQCNAHTARRRPPQAVLAALQTPPPPEWHLTRQRDGGRACREQQQQHHPPPPPCQLQAFCAKKFVLTSQLQPAAAGVTSRAEGGGSPR